MNCNVTLYFLKNGRLINNNDNKQYRNFILYFTLIIHLYYYFDITVDFVNN